MDNKLQISDPAHNKGYILIKELREFLKLRKIDQDSDKSAKFDLTFGYSTDNLNSEVYLPTTPISERKPTKSQEHLEDKDAEIKESKEEIKEEIKHDPSLRQSMEKSLSSSKIVIPGAPKPPLHTWPKYPPDFTPVFNEAFDSFMEISWRLFLALFGEAQRANEAKEGSIHNDLRQQLDEKSSICLLHYLTVQEDQENEPCVNPKLATMNKIKRTYPQFDTVEEQRVVDSIHYTSGIFTLFICNEVPGLQIFDRRAKAWMDVERELRPGKDVIVTIGQKAKMFLNIEEFEPTALRVLLEVSKEKYASAFLFDVSK